MQHLNVIYVENGEADMRAIAGVYDKLFTNFRFSQVALDEADVVVYADASTKANPDEPDAVVRSQQERTEAIRLFLTRPDGRSFATFVDKDGMNVYMSGGRNLAVEEDVVAYLNRKGFFDADDGGVQIVPHITNLLVIKDDSYLDMLLRDLSSHKPDTFDAFVERILMSLLNDEATVRTLARLYIHEFYVSFTSRSFVGTNIRENVDRKARMDNATNYEVREYVGDRASWSVMTDYFLMRFPGIGVRHLTALHRDFCSKEVQASIARSLFFADWIRTSDRIDEDTFEDVFEAFIGTLYEISFREQLRGERTPPSSMGSRWCLHDIFLREVYDSFEFAASDKKPEFTALNENMLAMGVVMKSVLRKTNNRIFARVKDDAFIDFMPANESTKLAQMLIKGRRYDELTRTREQDTFYREVNEHVIRIVGLARLENIKNEKYADADQLAKLREAAFVKVNSRQPLGNELDRFVVRLRSERVEKNSPDTFLILTVIGDDGSEKQSFSTEKSAYPDNSESLLCVINGQPDDILATNEILLDSMCHRSDGSELYFIDDSGTEMSFHKRIDAKTANRYLEGRNLTAYVNLFGQRLVYVDRVVLEFDDSFGRFLAKSASTPSSISRLFGYEHVPSLQSEDVLAYVGNRRLLTYGNRILYSRLPDANERDLTQMQTFYFSKVVKRELMRMMGNEDGNFDVLVGQLPVRAAEALINVIYLSMRFNDEDAFDYGKEVNMICERITQEKSSTTKPSAKLPTKSYVRPKSCFLRMADGYRFTFGDIDGTISYRQKTYAICKRFLEKQAYDILLRTYGAREISDLMNARVVRHPGYAKLASLMRQRGMDDFRVAYTDNLGRKRLLVRVGFKEYIFDDLDDAFAYLDALRTDHV